MPAVARPHSPVATRAWCLPNAAWLSNFSETIHTSPSSDCSTSKRRHPGSARVSSMCRGRCRRTTPISSTLSQIRRPSSSTVLMPPRRRHRGHLLPRSVRCTVPKLSMKSAIRISPGGVGTSRTSRLRTCTENLREDGARRYRRRSRGTGRCCLRGIGRTPPDVRENPLQRLTGTDCLVEDNLLESAPLMPTEEARSLRSARPRGPRRGSARSGSAG